MDVARQPELHRPPGRRALAALFTLLAWLAPRPARPATEDDLAELSLTDLMAVKVTSVSKREENLGATAAAVTVLSNDDIRRSGATHLTDLLRLVPGVQVAQASSDSWAVSIRGFNDLFADKLLVLIDGRSVYTPLFAGVYWDVQDLVLADIERIEVIRGPGSAVWGANAVNGVIDVITKSAADTRGAMTSVAAGDELRFQGTARFGTALDDHTSVRAFAKGFVRDGFATGDGADAGDGWHQMRAGFRADGAPSSRSSWTLTGDGYVGQGHETLDLVESLTPYSTAIVGSAIDVAGGNVLGRWTLELGDAGRATAQAYWDHTLRDTAQLAETRDTADLEVQHQLTWWSRNELVVGAASRVSIDALDSSLTTELHPSSRTRARASAFAENRTSLADDTVGLVLGGKLEWNDPVGFDVQPTARLSWTPVERFTLWSAVSRAIRTPSRGEQDIVIRGVPFAAQIPKLPPLTLAPRIEGNSDMRAEELLAIDAGMRAEPFEGVTLDVAAFFDRYDRLLSANAQPPAPRRSPRSSISSCAPTTPRR